MSNPWMLASQLDVDALIFTRTSEAADPGITPDWKFSLMLNAAAKRFR
jgi:hypothetical protein